MTTKAIGVTDAEMRVYAEYKNSLTDILDKINEISETLLEFERGKFIDSKSVVNVTNYSKDRYFRDRNLLNIGTKEFMKKWQDQYIKTYRDRLNYCLRIEEILKSLDSDSFNILYMRYFDDMTFEQIGKKIYMSPQGVSNRIRKLLKNQPA